MEKRLEMYEKEKKLNMWQYVTLALDFVALVCFLTGLVLSCKGVDFNESAIRTLGLICWLSASIGQFAINKKHCKLHKEKQSIYKCNSEEKEGK